MKTIKPNYYDKFACIAGACDFTCCQEWKIAVDDLTMKRWKTLAGDTDLTEHTQLQMGGYAIKLDEKRKCPFLKEDGLCRLVLAYGEECLSQTCHTFPRERHEFANRVEYSLDLGCKRVLEMLWENTSFQLLTEDDETEQVAQWACEAPEYYFAIRDWFLDIASDTALSPETALKIIFYLMLELEDAEKKESLTDEFVRNCQNSNLLRKLKEELKAFAADKQSIPYDTFAEDNELLLDVMDNYRKQKIYSDALEPIARRAEAYESISGRKCESRCQEFAGIWKQLESKMRSLLCEEIYASCLIPDSTLENMVLKLEWLAMEYVIIRQWLFLQWDLTGELTEEDTKKAVSVIFRVTGYSDDDITEYLENSFETPIWDWGYISFIL